MKRKTALAVAGVVTAAMAAATPGRVYVDTGVKGPDVPESLYGIFFEEINHSGDGGLYAELIQNRGFEEHVIPSGCTYSNGKVYAPKGVASWNDNSAHNWSVTWDLESKKYTAWTVASSGCTLEREVMEMEEPLHANTPNAMRLVISDSGNGSTARLINEGYWGVAVKSGDKYNLRFYARTSDYSGNILAMVTDNAGNSIGQLELKAVSDGKWTEYTGVITATKTVGDGTFCLQFSGDGTVDVDYVSLFPQDTFRGRENGLRRDIAEALEALNPRFMRWPGGCVVEGLTLENRVKWKETIGDPMERRGEYDVWGYRSTWGLGYHEVLLFCEDLGMDVMFVGNLGMSCCGRNGDFVRTYEDLVPYIQDIRDAIEYAIGDPATNEWAARRAAAGHPEPFALKYVELGNENFGSYYAQLFNWAYDELKAEYPDLVFINTIAHNDTGLSKCPVNDMVDTHWYKTPDWFYDTNTFEFDNLDRAATPYDIYVGEYACNEGVGSGNLDAALSESVFMINLERNGDVVKLASYAPLISNQNKPDWTCNLIWVNSTQTVGRASYWAQQLFATNRPSHAVRNRLMRDERPFYAGRIALGTYETTAEFRNVVCTSPSDGRVLYSDDLASDSGDWSNPVSRGAWEYSEGVLKQTTLDQSTYFTMNCLSFNDVVFEFEARKTGGNEGFLINLGCNDEDIDQSWRFNIGGWSNTASNLENATGYWGTTVCTSVPMVIENDRWYKIKMVGSEGVLSCYIDDELICQYTQGSGDSDVSSGRLSIGAGYDSEAGEVVVKVVNAYGDDFDTTVTLNATNINSMGTVTTLGSDLLYWENSFDEPELIVPVTEAFDGFADTFDYTFPAYSLTIMRVKADEATTAIEFPARNYTDVPVELTVTTDLERAAAMLSRLIERAEYGAEASEYGRTALTAAVADAARALDDASATVDSLYAAFDTLCEALESFYNYNMYTPAECTSQIKNPKFDSLSTEGWRGGSNITLGSSVAEYYNGSFGISQHVEGLENGFYMLTMQGFYREGRDSAQALYEARGEHHYAVLSAGDQSVPVRSCYSTALGTHSMTGAATLFRSSNWASLNYVICEVTDGTLDISLIKDTTVTYDWVCFDNFRLFLLGEGGAGIDVITVDNPVEGLSTMPVYDLAGRQVATQATFHKLQPGIYISGGTKLLKTN